MEEKKFPWILRLLAINRCCIPLLDTMAANKDRIIATFTLDLNSAVCKIFSRTLGFTTTQGCIHYILSSKLSGKPSSIKHCFFLHKGTRREVGTRELTYYDSSKVGIPIVSYIQFTKKHLSSFVVYSVEYCRHGYTSSLHPQVSDTTVMEQAKEISKLIISLIELHENKKVIKLNLELMLDTSHKVWLSNLILCIITAKDNIKHGIEKINVNSHKTNELLDMINELDSPSKILRRQPSLIKKVDTDGAVLDRIRIESPDFDRGSSLSEDEKEDHNKNHKNQSMIMVKNELTNINSNFLELLCRTRIVEDQPIKKLLILDEEYKTEYDKVSKMIHDSHKSRPEIKSWIQKSNEFRKYKKSDSIIISDIKINSTRSSSMLGFILPVLSSRSRKYHRF